MKYALMVLQLLPTIIDIIQKLEEVMPESGKGKEKLETLRKILSIVHPNVTEYWETIEKIVSVIVSFFNKNEVFIPPTEE